MISTPLWTGNLNTHKKMAKSRRTRKKKQELVLCRDEMFVNRVECENSFIKLVGGLFCFISHALSSPIIIHALQDMSIAYA